MRWFRRTLAALLISITTFVGCLATVTPCDPTSVPTKHPSIDVRIYIESSFSEEQRQDILTGVGIWGTQTNGYVVWHLLPLPEAGDIPRGGVGPDAVEERVVVFKKTWSTTDRVKQWDVDHKKTVIGMLVGNGSRYAEAWLVEDRLRSRHWFSLVASHEFGHGLGLDHVKDKSSVMSEYLSPIALKLTKHDLDELCRRHACVVEVCTTEDE